MKLKVPKSDQSKRLKLYRRYKKLSQDALGVIVKKKQVTIGRYERGELFIPEYVIKSLHDELGMSYTWFYEGTGPMDNEKVSSVSPAVDSATLETKILQLELRVKKLETFVQKLEKSNVNH